MTNFFHTHVHSEFSCLDAMSDINVMAAKAAKFNQPALAITDHGNMSGVFQLYKACKKNDLLPFPGLEAYLVDDIDSKDSKRHHLTLLALNTKGYKTLAKLCSLSHQRDRYHYKPRIGLSDLAELSSEGLSKDIALLTGCYFGMVQQAVVGDSTESATRVAKMLAGWFPHTFVEIQHHNTDHGDGWDDTKLAHELFQVANEIGRPPIITQDCHYCDKSHRHLHDFMKSIAYSSEIGDVSFPGDSYHLASTPWVKKHYRESLEPIWQASDEAFGDLIGRNQVEFPILDNYKYHVPSIGEKNPNTTLRKLCRDALKDAMLDTVDEYKDRLEYELSVIKGLGMSDYFLLVNDYVGWCLEQNILVMARGSAAGSLVCFLLGTTQIDPLKWNLTFDRFLTPDRIRPPDIDLDIEDTRRGDVVEYLEQKYSCVQIGTYNRLGFDEETGRGGLFVQYIAGMRKRLGEAFPSRLGQVQSLHDLDKVSPDEASMIRGLADLPLRRSPGAHAAGFVIGNDEHKVEDWLPTMLIPSSNSTVTQAMMDDVEDAGFVKIDLLGLRSLTTMRRCLELISKTSPSFIPLDDKKTMAFLRKGRPDTGVFQLEGYTASQGCKEVKVKTVGDIVLVNALYRPATRDHGYTDLFIDNRANPKQIYYPHEIFKDHLSETFGVPVFQEQVLAILRDLGMPVEELNDFLTAVKGKHATGGYSDKSIETFLEHKNKFESLCSAVGMCEGDIIEAWGLVEGFAAYGFNRAHATAYGLFGYQMAYLKIHYPLEFHTALLETTAGSDKEKKYIKEARKMEIRILSADVNSSGTTWTMIKDKNAIRRGLVSVKGVGLKAAECLNENAPYSDMDDLIARCPARSVSGGSQWSKSKKLVGTLRHLQNAGALKSLNVQPEPKS